MIFWHFILYWSIEKTLDSPLDSKEIKPVHPKGNQPRIFIGKDWCWSWNSNTLATWCKKPTHWKRPWFWDRLGAGEEGDDRGWDGWMASLTQRTWVWTSSGRWWRTGKPGVLQSMGLQRVGHHWATEQQQLNNVTDALFHADLLPPQHAPHQYSWQCFENVCHAINIYQQQL